MDKRNIEDVLALTPMQEGMLFHYLKDPTSDYYFEQLSLQISGEIDLKLFEKAWNSVIQSNEMLRAVFRWENLENPVQIILKEHILQQRYYDFSGNDVCERERRLKKVKIEDRKEKFDLQEVPFRVTLCRLEKTKYVMMISNHHILYDGWSSGIILKEFFKAHNDLSNRKELVKPVKTKFTEFVKWIQNQDKNEQGKFWKNYLNGFDTSTGLPVKKRKTREITTHVPGIFRVSFSRGLKDKIENFLTGHKITLASFLYSAWGILLQKYKNSGDVIFGTTVSGRAAKIKGMEDMVGLFINTLPLRIQTAANEKNMDFLYRIDKELQMREPYETTSLVEIKGYSEIENKEELFDSIVVIENYPLESRLILENTNLSVESYSIFEMTHYDLFVSITVFNDVELAFFYHKNGFAQESVVRLGNHFRGILEDVLKNPGKEVGDIEIISEAEKNKILYQFNNTETDYPKDKTIHQLFEEQVERTPDSTAVVGPGLKPTWQQVTYKELKRKANQLAYLLKKEGVQPPTIIVIIPERSVEMIIGIFGILKAGGSYLPLDLHHPGERIKYIIKDSCAKILVTTRALAEKHEKIREWRGRIIFLEAFHNVSPLALANVASPSNPVYTIYTSGSTGKPKGVIIGNRSLVNFIKGIANFVDIRESDNVLSLTTISFDIFGLEAFLPLIAGAKVIVGNEEAQLDPQESIALMDRKKITIFQLTPSRLKLLLAARGAPKVLGTLRYLLVGGEEFPEILLKEVQKITNGKIYNLYGPTETTIWSTVKDVTDEKSINIGKPIANTRVYILGKSEGIQPPGLPGELCIAGDGLARGYLNQPELTAEKFTRKNFLLEGTRGLAPLLYKTGDLARWLQDGNIEFLGRIDHQVKIRGFRIELQEIEDQLMKHPRIKEAVVLAREEEGLAGTGYMYLSAYIVPSHGENLENTPSITAELREYLADTLPDYMIPGYFMLLEKLPLTPNGKINRKALPGLPVHTKTTGITAPADEIEAKLVSVWSVVLKIGKESIDVNSNFFNIGGHSLRAIQLVSRIHQVFNVRVPMLEIFKKSTIKKLALYIKKAAFDKHAFIEAAEKKEYYTLSPAQRGLYFRQQMKEGEITNNMPAVYLLEGDIHRSNLENTFKGLIKRHESLRTSLGIVDEEPFQKVHKEVEFELETYGAVRTAGSSQSLSFPGQVKELFQRFLRPFDLSRPPLLRARLLEIEKKKHILMIDMSHLISDGFSGEIFIKEYKALYSGEELPPLNIHYKDFVAWQKRLTQKGKLKKQEEYWLNRFNSQESFPGLPTDFPRQSNLHFEGEGIDFVIETGLKKDLDKMAIETETTLYMVLLAAFNILLARHSLQECVIVGSPVLGRTHSQLENMIGMFVNLLAMMNFPSATKTFREFLAEVKKNSLQAFANQDYQFDQLVRKLNLQRIPGRHPLFDSVFSFFKNENRNNDRHHWGDLQIIPYQLERTAAKFDLQLRVNDDEGILRMTIEYKTSLFKRETVEIMKKHFIEILEQTVENQDIPLSSINISHDLLAAGADLLEKDQSEFGF